MWKCPHCEEEIEHLSYNVSTYSSEYGTAYLIKEPNKNTLENRDESSVITEHDSSDQGDTNWDGNPEYECPECSRSVDISDLVWSEDEEDKEEKPKEEILEETTHNIILPETNIMEDDQPEGLEGSLICKHCRHIFVYETDKSYSFNKTSEFFECPKCGGSNSTVEFKTLLDQGFFNQNQHANHTKKIKHRLIKSLVISKPKIHS